MAIEGKGAAVLLRGRASSVAIRASACTLDCYAFARLPSQSAPRPARWTATRSRVFHRNPRPDLRDFGRLDAPLFEDR
jgi:hypothetical protein